MKSGMQKTECHELTDAELGRVAGGFNSLEEFGNYIMDQAGLSAAYKHCAAQTSHPNGN
jgi:hypothetical protein